MAPPNWTDDPRSLDETSTWSNEGSGTYMASVFGLEPPFTSIICSTPNTGNLYVIFSAKGVFYLWNQVADSVCKIDDPTTKDGILSLLTTNNGSPKLLKVTNVEPPITS